jgi:hypothetical protein
VGTLVTDYLSCEACNAELASVELFFGSKRSDGTVWLGNKCGRIVQILAKLAGVDPKRGTPLRVVT